MSLLSAIARRLGWGQGTVAAEPSAKPAAKRRTGISDAMMARSAQPPAEEKVNPFVIPQHLPGVLPSGTQMAMDDATGQAMQWAALAAEQYSEGLAFLGYPALAQLAQRPEYRKISETIATEMTRKWITIQAAGNDDKTDKVATITEAFKRLNVQEVFREAALQDGFFGRSHVFIDIGNSDDRDEMAKPIGDGHNDISKAKVGRAALKRLRNVEAVWCSTSNYNALDPLAPDFYRPSAWYVQGKDIHASRLLTFIGRPVPDLLKPGYAFGGLSLSQMAKPYVDNWIRTRQSVSDLLHSFSTNGIKTNLTDQLNVDDGANLFKRIKFFTNMRDNKGVMVLDKGDGGTDPAEEFFNVSTPLGTLDKLQAQSQEQICSVASIPLVKFTGITPSGLNACLPADTLITTDRGQVQICDITTDDKVLTREGFAPLKFAGVTKYANELIEIKTASKTLLCTGNHPIWLPGVGEFVPAENVLRGDRLLLIGGKPDARRTRRQSHGEDNGGGVVVTDTMLHGTVRHAVQFSSIGEFGRSIAGLCQKVSTSIISTATRLITSIEANDDGSVLSVMRIPAGEWVYDLSVVDGYLPEFYANGILTHNSSEGEIRVFYDWIAAYQELLFTENLTRVLGFVQLSEFGEVDPAISFKYEPLWSLDEKGLAEVRKVEAETGAVLIASKVITPAEERQRIGNDPDTLYASLDENEAPVAGVSDADKATIAATLTAAIVGAAENGVIDEGIAMRELAKLGPATGLWTTITPADIVEAEAEPPAPEKPTIPDATTANDGEFREDDHPRRDDGKFGSGGGASKPHKDVSGGILQAEHAAIKHYTGAGHRNVNGHLEGGVAATDETKASIAALDGMMSRAAIAEPKTVYRGAGSLAMKNLINSAGGTIKKGSVVEIKGFVSTSSDAGVARGFAAQSGSGFSMEIKLPKGSQAVDVSSLSDAGSREKETLLARGGRFKVLSYDQKSKRMTLEMLPPGKSATGAKDEAPKTPNAGYMPDESRFVWDTGAGMTVEEGDGEVLLTLADLDEQNAG